MDGEDDRTYHDEDPVAEERGENVEVSWSDDTAVDLVEHLQEHKGVKDDREVLSLCKSSVVLVRGLVFKTEEGLAREDYQ